MQLVLRLLLEPAVEVDNFVKSAPSIVNRLAEIGHFKQDYTRVPDVRVAPGTARDKRCVLRECRVEVPLGSGVAESLHRKDE